MYQGYQPEYPTGESGDPQDPKGPRNEVGSENPQETGDLETQEEPGESEDSGDSEKPVESEGQKEIKEPGESENSEDINKSEESGGLQGSIGETGNVEKPEEPPMSAEEFEAYCEDLKERVADLSQEEVDAEILFLLKDYAKDSAGKERLLVWNGFLPDKVTAEQRRTGQSPWAKVYRSLFNISRTAKYKEDPKLIETVRFASNFMEQEPQMMGPVAMWELAKDVMWRKDVPSYKKSGLIGSMTYALSFFDLKEYETELLKNLDFENIENYASTAHMLEALKQFWSDGHQSFSREVVPDFYLQALKKVDKTPQANFLLSMRAQEILSLLEQSDDFPFEDRDLTPFELSKGVYASDQTSEEGLMIIPEQQNQELERSISDFEAVEEQLTPPQWMIDEAIERGESSVMWTPPQHLMSERSRLFSQMHQLATVPLEDRLGELKNLDPETKEQMLFDYEYLVSRPMREMIQREFGFELKELSLREQFYFLNYLKQITVAEADQMKEFTSQYGVKGMRTFLSLEQGGKTLGDKIVAFGQHNEVAEKVFEYYSQLLDRAERAEELVQEISGAEGDAALELADQVYNNIVNRAQKDLIQAVSETDPSRVADQVETYTAEAKEYVALLQEVGAGQIEEVNSQELTEADKEQMKALLEANYNKLYPGSENEAFRKLVAGSLDNGFSNPDTVFKILRDKDKEKIVSYNRFDIVGDSSGKEVTYFASFNVDPAYSGVGSVMLEETVKSRLEDGRPMIAHCDPEQSITRKYIEDGFVATNFYEVAGQPSFEIWRSRDSGEVLQSKNMTAEELLEQTDDKDSITVRQKQSGEQYPELQAERALTRYFIHEGRTYLVFEDLPESLRLIFTVPEPEDETN